MTTRRVVVVSLLVDVLDVISNLVVALVTGSAVVFAEMSQGLADAIGSTFLVVGHGRSERPRDANHPFGYSREVFFWALLSALVMLVVGAGLSLWRGIGQLNNPRHWSTRTSLSRSSSSPSARTDTRQAAVWYA